MAITIQYIFFNHLKQTKMAKTKIEFSLSDALKKQIKSKAKKAKLSAAEWLRQAVKSALK